MSISTLATRHAAPTRLARASDFLELTKPRIAVLVLVAVAVSAYIGSLGYMPWEVLCHTLLGTTLVASSASAVNQLLERRRDALMDRTASRPLPDGRIPVKSAWAFAWFCLAAGVGYLALAVGWETAGWGVLTWVLYTCVYTPLKTRSSINTAVGAVAGALPIMIGWSAAGRSIDLQGGALFLLLFLWQFPHFMAIAWLYRDQYELAGMKMLTVIDPTGRRAGVQAVLGALAVLLASLVPVLVAPPLQGASLYGSLAFGLGLMQLISACCFLVYRSQCAARWLLRASLIYLPSLLVLLVLTSF